MAFIQYAMQIIMAFLMIYSDVYYASESGTVRSTRVD